MTYCNVDQGKSKRWRPGLRRGGLLWALAIMPLLPLVAQGQACDTVFPGGLQSHRASGQISFDWNAQLLDNPDTRLPVARVKNAKWSMLSSCGDESCTAAGDPSASMDIEIFQSNDDTDLQLDYRQEQTLGQQSDYRHIEVGVEGRLAFESNSEGYRIKRLKLAHAAELVLAPGDYWIEKLDLASAVKIRVVGEGTARVYVKHKVSFPFGASVNMTPDNEPDNPGRFFLYSRNDIRLQTGARVSGLLYTRKRLSLAQSELYGSGSFHRANLGTSARVHHRPDALAATDLQSVCDGGAPTPDEPEEPSGDEEAELNACQATWPNGLQVHSPDGAIDFQFNAQLNEPARTDLFSPTVQVHDWSPRKSCGDTHCTAQGSPVEPLDAGAFQTSPSEQTVQVPWQGTATLGEDEVTDYGVIDVAASAQLTLHPRTTAYRIRALHLGYDSQLSLPAGDYWVETLSMEAEARVRVVGNGTIRLFVRNPLYVPWQASLNEDGGDPSQLVLYHYDDLEFHTGSLVNGLIYARGEIALNYQAQINGGITARQIALDTDSQVTYVPDAVLVAEYGALCPEDNEPPDNTPPELVLDAVESETEADSITLTGTVLDPEDADSGLASVVARTDEHQISATLDGEQFTVTVPLSLGENVITVEAEDVSGNITEQSVTVTRVELDETPPELDIHNTDGQSVEAATVTVTGTAVDPEQHGSGVDRVVVYSDRYSDLDFAAQLQSPEFSAEVPLAVGDNRLRVVATDLSGNSAEAALSVRRISPPEIRGVTPADGEVIQAEEVTISGTVKTRQPLEDLRFSINEWQLTPTPGAEEGIYRFEQPDIPLQIGQNRFVLSVNSPDGSAEHTLTLSHTPEDADSIPAPELTLLEPLDGSLVNDESVRVRGRVTSHAGAVTVSLNGQPVSTSGSNNRDYYFDGIVSFPEGDNSLAVTLEAVDGLDKTSTLNATYYRDSQQPVIVLNGLSEAPTVNSVMESPYPVSGTVTDDNLANLTVNGEPVSLRPGDGSGQYRFRFGLPLAPGETKDLLLEARDLGGNHTAMEVHLASDATAEINPLLPGENTELIGRGEPIELQVAARITEQEAARVRVSSAGAQTELEVGGTLANGTLTLSPEDGEHTLTYELLSEGGDLLASATRSLTVVDEQSIPLALQRHEPENNARHIEANQPVELYFNRPVDLDQLTVEVLETLHGETYINEDEPGADFLNAQGFQLRQVHRDREEVPGTLSALPGNQGVAFYPERHFGFNARLYVDVLHDEEELGRFTFQVRPLPTFIIGGVRDQFGQPLPGVTVELPELGRTVETNNDGSFAFGFQERPGNEIPAGRHRVVVNPEFATPGFGTQVLHINVQAGRRNELEVTRLAQLHPDVSFQLVSSYEEQAVLAGGDLKLNLSDTRLLFNNGRTSGKLQVQFMPFEQLNTRVAPGAVPYWMFAAQPRGIRVEGDVGLTLSVPARGGSHDYLVQDQGYVVLLGYEPEREVIQPVGVGYLENQQVISAGSLNLEVLDFIGFAQVDPRLQDELEAVANGDLTLQQLQTLLQQQTASQP